MRMAVALSVLVALTSGAKGHKWNQVEEFNLFTDMYVGVFEFIYSTHD